MKFVSPLTSGIAGRHCTFFKSQNAEKDNDNDDGKDYDHDNDNGGDLDNNFRNNRDNEDME